jgi:hypothetical protein
MSEDGSSGDATSLVLAAGNTLATRFIFPFGALPAASLWEILAIQKIGVIRH